MSVICTNISVRIGSPPSWFLKSSATSTERDKIRGSLVQGATWVAGKQKTACSSSSRHLPPLQGSEHEATGPWLYGGRLIRFY